MSFFRKLFGKGRPHLPPPNDSATQFSKVRDTTKREPIRAFDKFGRELLIPRDEWLHNVLPGQLKQDWNDADSLARDIIQAFQDGIFAEVEEAACRLREIDPKNPRSASLLGITYLNTGRPDQAEKTLHEHITKHGADGVVLTNLAKAQSSLGKNQESLKTLWQALELDPNQDNGLGWYEVIHREQKGEDAGIEALRRVATLPGSWRAQLWLARKFLVSGDIDSALDLYRTSLAVAGKSHSCRFTHANERRFRQQWTFTGTDQFDPAPIQRGATWPNGWKQSDQSVHRYRTIGTCPSSVAPACHSATTGLARDPWLLGSRTCQGPDVCSGTNSTKRP